MITLIKLSDVPVYNVAAIALADIEAACEFFEADGGFRRLDAMFLAQMAKRAEVARREAVELPCSETILDAYARASAYIDAVQRMHFMYHMA